jgi:hypothetical protein
MPRRGESFQVPVQLAVGMPTEVVNHRKDAFSGGTPKNSSSSAAKNGKGTRRFIPLLTMAVRL